MSNENQGTPPGPRASEIVKAVYAGNPVDPVCNLCHEPYDIPPDCDTTPLCNGCAHESIVVLAKEVSRLSAESAKDREAASVGEAVRRISRKAHTDEQQVIIEAEAMRVIRPFAARVSELEAQVDKLAKFKAYVHKRLDEAGVPVDPESSHKAEGCRIGGRLDIVLGAVAEYTTVRPLKEWHEDYGPVLWWHLPIAEPPYVGSPLGSDWEDGVDEGYYTHWSKLPVPAGEGASS